MTPITTREAIRTALQALAEIDTVNTKRAAALLCEQYGFKMQEFFVEEAQ
jgi:hypothetical protein